MSGDGGSKDYEVLRDHGGRNHEGYDPMALLSRAGSTMNVLWFLLVGVIAGWLAGILVKGGGFGLVGDLVVGIIGALLGGLLFSGLGGAVGGGLLGSIVVATLGAVILLVVLRVLKRA